MRYALDANICILLLMGHPQVVARVGRCDQGDLAISSIAFGEVAIGIMRSKPPSLDRLDALIDRVVTLLPFDEPAARCYAGLPFKRGSFDRLIGAHALSLGLTLITNNLDDFADLPGLQVEDWTI